MGLTLQKEELNKCYFASFSVKENNLQPRKCRTKQVLEPKVGKEVVSVYFLTLIKFQIS